MNTIVQNKFFRVGVIGTAIFLALFLAAKAIGAFKGISAAYAENPPVQTITVSGKGEVLVKPDIAVITFGVIEEAATVAAAQKKAADKMNAAIKFLKESGVAEKDIKTVNYNIYPRYEFGPKGQRPVVYPPYPPEGTRSLVGYEISQTVEVKIRKLDEAGKILAGLGAAGVNNLSGLNLINDKEDELRKEARSKAIADARADAKKLARDLGVRLSKIISFSESGIYPVYFGKAAVGLERGGDAAPTPPEIPSGENRIVTNVTITYEIR
ncbi:MAG: SIMPL domain-containing protein [Candidatus Taylorbacteria bacterium]|nr:SIMPL domain-containing protein [Candidatus Taylorbacteria bacterium]